MRRFCLTIFAGAILAHGGTFGAGRGLPCEESRRVPTALRSNLLFDLAGAPNLGVEVGVGQRMSVGVDAAFAYWHAGDSYALQTAQLGLGAKYWFGTRHATRPLTGFNAGVYAMAGSRYDVQWCDGWQGDGFWSAGLSAGYSVAVGQRLNMEFALAAGYFFTPEARHYHRPENDRLVWRQTRRNVGRVSLTKAQINLVWLLGR